MKIIKKVKRLIPAGGINPNTNKPYTNMEIKIQEMFDYFSTAFCDVPISVRNEEDVTIPEVRPEDIIGFVRTFSDTDMTIEILREDLFNLYKNPVVEIISIADNNLFENETYIKQVLKLVMSESRE